MIPEDKPFIDREDVKTDIRLCAWMGTIIIFISLICATIGVISEVLDETLVLESISWFLLAIVFAVIAIVPNMRSLTAKLIYGIESETKSQ